MSGYKDIDEEILLYHMQDKGFNQLIKDMMVEETKVKIESITLQSLSAKEEYLEKKNIKIEEDRLFSEKKEEIYKYNSLITITNDMVNRNGTTLLFGDILKDDGCYYLCITPHCDCVRPDRIGHNYTFIRNMECGNSEAIKDAEKGYFSYVKDDRYIPLKWSNRIEQINITGEYSDNSVRALFLGETIEKTLKYVCRQRENYTQRVANNAASHLSRVGVSLMSIEAENREEEPIEADLGPEIDDKKISWVKNAFQRLVKKALG